jgi:L-aspartate oxidase
MSRSASVVRGAAGLQSLTELVNTTRLVEPRTRAQFEDVALTATAAAVAAAATARTESRGCHHRAEYPGTDDHQAHRTVVRLVQGRAAVETAVAC